MTYAYELSKHTTIIKGQIRKLESIKYKILRCKWSTIFNKICLKENMHKVKDSSVIKFKVIYITKF